MKGEQFLDRGGRDCRGRDRSDYGAMADTANFSAAQFMLAIFAGYTIASLCRFLHLRQCRSCAFRLDPTDDRRPLPWYGQLIHLTFIVGGAIAFIIRLALSRRDYSFYIIPGAAIAICLFGAIRVIVKERPQFTLWSLFQFTTLTACLCSASRYIPIVPLVVFLYFPAMEWARQRACRHGQVSAEPGSISIGEMSEQFVASRCASTVRRAWLRFFCAVSIGVLLLLYWLWGGTQSRWLFR